MHSLKNACRQEVFFSQCPNSFLLFAASFLSSILLPLGLIFATLGFVFLGFNLTLIGKSMFLTFKSPFPIQLYKVFVQTISSLLSLSSCQHCPTTAFSVPYLFQYLIFCKFQKFSTYKSLLFLPHFTFFSYTTLPV